MIRAARRHEIALLPQIENAADERYVRLGLHQVLTMPPASVASLECCIVSLPRDVPYLGPLRPGESINAQGYFVRLGNRTVYPATDMSVIVKATATNGMVGWGDYETVVNVVAKEVERGPFLLGERFTAADVVIGSGLRWGMMFKMLPERKEFADYVARCMARPAAGSALAKDEAMAKQSA